LNASWVKKDKKRIVKRKVRRAASNAIFYACVQQEMQNTCFGLSGDAQRNSASATTKDGAPGKTKGHFSFEKTGFPTMRAGIFEVFHTEKKRFSSRPRSLF